MSAIFENLSQTITVKLGTDLLHNASSLISSIAPLFSIGFGIYILLVIINAYGRGFDENIVDLSKRLVGWLVIIACAFNASQYDKLANMIYSMPEGLASVFGNHFSINAFDVSTAKLSSLIDRLGELDHSFHVLQVGTHFVMSGVVTPIVMLCGYTIIGVSFAFYAVAKISLALVLMVGPLFIGCMLFPATRTYGMNWIGQCANYVINTVMLSLLCSIALSFFDGKVSEFDTEALSNIAAAMLLPGIFLIMTFLFLIVAWNIPSITNALTGGASIGGFSHGIRNIASTGRAVGALGGSAARGAGAIMSRIRGSGGSVSKG